MIFYNFKLTIKHTNLDFEKTIGLQFETNDSLKIA